MFNDKVYLTQAVLEGAKTMIRCEEKPTSIVSGKTMQDVAYSVGGLDDNGNWYFSLFTKNDTEIGTLFPCYNIGEVIAIAEAYKDLYPSADFETDGKNFLTESAGWKNKMFVKSAMMKHHIKITDVKLERLQWISFQDCLREGICVSRTMLAYSSDSREIDDIEKGWFNSSRRAFAFLIDKLSGKGTWGRNPWVVVYTFERID